MIAVCCRRPGRVSGPRTTKKPRRAFSAKPLQKGGDVSYIVGRQALGNGLHDAVGSRAARSRCIVVQLLHDIDRVLAAERRELCRLVTESGGPMAGHTRGNAPGT